MTKITNSLYTVLPNQLPRSPHQAPEADEGISSNAESTDEPSASVHPSDGLHFGHLWPQIRGFVQEGKLDALIIERRQEIARLKETWRPFIEEMTQNNGPWQSRMEDVQRLLTEGNLTPCPHGSGGAYFLRDSSGVPHFVIKPLDEDMLCLHNRKQRASPFSDSEHRARDAIPLYESAQREAAASSIACDLHLPDITPRTTLGIIRSPVFYDISEALDQTDRSAFIERVGAPDKEKLCSIQPFIPGTIDLGEAMHEWFEAGMDQPNQLFPFDQESFENTNLLVWATYDCDGHGSNYLLYLHSLDPQGKPVYGLMKIDNGLCLPAQNKYLINYLAYLPNARLPLSVQLRERIANIDCAVIAQDLKTYGLHDSVEAALTRISVLKNLAERPQMTIEEMNLRMELLSHPLGQSLALSECSRQELDDLIMQNYFPNHHENTTTPTRQLQTHTA